MGNNKWLFLAGLGAGAALTLRMSDKQISNVKQFASKIANSENVTEARQVASAKFNEVLRSQGSKLVDKLAEGLKSQLNAAGASWAGFAEADSSDPDNSKSTTSTDNDGNTRDKDGHIIIDGKIVS